jgi:hypothetical protein
MSLPVLCGSQIYLYMTSAGLINYIAISEILSDGIGVVQPSALLSSVVAASSP